MLTYEEIRAFSERACQTDGYLAPPDGFVATREQVEEAIRAALAHAAEKGNHAPIAGDQLDTTLRVPPSDVICAVAGVTIFGPSDAVNAAHAALSAPTAPTYPDELTPELREVLGWPNFRCGPIAHVFQAAGYVIPKRAEAEQAFVLHWLTKLVLRHGADWWSVANDEIAAIQKQLTQQQPSPGDGHD